MEIVDIVTCGLSLFIGAGGGTARADALRAAGINLNMQVDATRWGQVLAMIKYLITPNCSDGPIAEQELRVINFLASDLQEVLIMASADSNNLNLDIERRVKNIGSMLSNASLPGRQGLILSEALTVVSYNKSAVTNTFAEEFMHVLKARHRQPWFIGTKT